MNGTHAAHVEGHSRFGALKVATGGLAMEGIGGIAALVLAIIGLAGTLQSEMAGISTILIGASLLFEGSAIVAGYRQLLSSLESTTAGSADFGGALTVEFLAGIAGIVLGILALLGLSANLLISVAIIAFGSAFLLGGGAAANLSSLWTSARFTTESSREVAREAVGVGTGAYLFMGVAAIVLGILALLGMKPMVLNLAGLLSLGVFVLLSGTAFGGKTMSALRRT